MEAVNKELSCPLCQALFEDPVILPCEHIMCRNCVLSRCVQYSSRCRLFKHSSEACLSGYARVQARGRWYLQKRVSDVQDANIQARFAARCVVALPSPNTTLYLDVLKFLGFLLGIPQTRSWRISYP